MKRRSLFVWVSLAIVCIILVVSIGLGVYFVSMGRTQKQITNQWVHVPPGTTPTVPADGYLFKDATGAFVVYHLPTTPPASITWITYHNQQEGYTIEYPATWIRVEHP